MGPAPASPGLYGHCPSASSACEAVQPQLLGRSPALCPRRRQRRPLLTFWSCLDGHFLLALGTTPWLGLPVPQAHGVPTPLTSRELGLAAARDRAGVTSRWPRNEWLSRAPKSKSHRLREEEGAEAVGTGEPASRAWGTGRPACRAAAHQGLGVHGGPSCGCGGPCANSTRAHLDGRRLLLQESGSQRSRCPPSPGRGVTGFCLWVLDRRDTEGVLTRTRTGSAAVPIRVPGSRLHTTWRATGGVFTMNSGRHVQFIPLSVLFPPPFIPLCLIR